MKRVVFYLLSVMFFSFSCESPYMVRHPVAPGDTYYLYATYYGDEFEGRQSADGSTFSQNEMSCAARGFPFGTYLEIKSISTGKKVVVKVTDRPGKNVVDLSKKAFSEIDDISKGKIKVKVKVVNRDSAEKVSQQEENTDDIKEESVKKTISYTLQLYKFGNIEDAKKTEAGLDFDCHIFADEDNYYVRCGNFSTMEEAEQFKNDNFDGKDDATVVEISD